MSLLWRSMRVPVKAMDVAQRDRMIGWPEGKETGFQIQFRKMTYLLED